MSTNDSELIWRRSHRCDTGSCLEVARLGAGVALRDSTLPDRPFLTFSGADWSGFVAELRAERWRRP